jgi:hypothetical protein
VGPFVGEICGRRSLEFLWVLLHLCLKNLLCVPPPNIFKWLFSLFEHQNYSESKKSSGYYFQNELSISSNITHICTYIQSKFNHHMYRIDNIFTLFSHPNMHLCTICTFVMAVISSVKIMVMYIGLGSLRWHSDRLLFLTWYL